MGVLDRFKAKYAAHKERREQVELNARPARLAALKKEKDLFEQRKKERALVNQVKALRTQERKEKLKPVTNVLSSFGTLAASGAKLAKNAAAKQNVKGANLASLRRDALFGKPNNNQLYEVRDWRGEPKKAAEKQKGQTITIKVR